MFCFDGSKLAELHSRLLAIAAPRSSLGASAVPSAPLLRQLVESAMALSLERDEGRQVRFALDFVPPDRVKTSTSDFLVRLSSPFPLSGLRRFAVAVDAWNTPIAIRPVETGWEAYGVVSLFKQEEGDPLILGDLLVRGVGAGVVVVEMGGSVVASITLGDTAFDLPGSPEILRLLDLLWDEQGGLARPASSALLKLAGRMVSLGHGGTLVVLQDGVDVAEANLELKYRLSDSSSLLLSSVEKMRRHPAPRRPDEVPTVILRYREALDRVARLTATDGALLMTEDFGVAGFGAVLGAGKAQLHLVELVDTELRVVRQVRISELGGTRQQSTARWLAGLSMNCRAVVFTLSADGGLRVFGRRGSGDVVYSGPLFLKLESDAK